MDQAKTKNGDNIGKVVQVIGPTVVISFHSDHLPDMLNAIKIKDAERKIDLTCEVALHVGDNVVRCIALSSTDGLVRGAPVVNTGGPITTEKVAEIRNKEGNHAPWTVPELEKIP